MGAVAKTYVVVAPKFDGFKEAVEAQISKTGTTSAAMGTTIGSKIGLGMSKGVAGSGAVMGAVSALTQKAVSVVSSHFASAAARFDTLSNYTTVMQNLGYSVDEADESLSKMDSHLQGLPTTLQDMVSTVQGLSAVTGDLSQATDAGLALNDMLLASGSNTQLVASAMEQFRQMLSKGKPDMQDWKSLTSAMPGQMKQLAEEMLGAGANASDLYAALGGGGAEATVSMDGLLAAMVRLDHEGGDGFASFAEQAKTASGGVQTSMANIGTAVTRGLANTMDAIGRDNISQAFATVKDAVNTVFSAINSQVPNAVALLKGLADNANMAVPAAISMYTAFKTVGTLGPILSKSGITTVRDALAGASLAAEGFGGKIAGIVGKLNPLAIGIAAVSAVVIGLGSALYDSWRRQKDFDDAVTGLSDAVAQTSGLRDYADGVELAGRKAWSSQAALDSYAESLKKHADAMKSNASSAEASIAPLNTLSGVIDDYAGKAAEGVKYDDLSAEAKGRIEYALKQLSDQFGITMSAQDLLNGSYTDEEGNVRSVTEAVNDLIEAKREEARVSAVTANLTEAYAAQSEALQNLENAQKQWQDTYNSSYENFLATGQMTEEQAAAAAKSTADNSVQVEKFAEAYDQACDSVSKLNEELGSTAGEAGKISDALKGMGSDLVRTLVDSGTSVSEFSTALADAGVSTETLREIGSENLAALAEACGGDVGKMVGSIEMYNALPIVDKDGNVNMNDVPLIDAQGRVYTWNGSELVGKDGSVVVDDVSLQDAQGRLLEWNGSELQYKDADGTVHDLMSSAVATRDEWNRTGLNSYEANGTINIFKNITETVTSFFGGGNAAGGFRLNAAGGFAPRLHAGGAIATRAVPLDIVGEDGAEAIVPLTNAKYSRPFARTLAQQMRETGGDEGATREVLDELMALHADMLNLKLYIDSKVAGALLAPELNRQLGRLEAAHAR